MASIQKEGNTWYFTVSRMVNGKHVSSRKGGFSTKLKAANAAVEAENKIDKES
ncbi:Arm DNA-binding domain-containing protein [Paenibacillus radicis (ex Xue et al. 2023)]|uniref:Arm DNA-binding domain-containing protein n=1 Tax=Paenibacillus radicis (ex Xue et al. 2023) TaxID=2972489 RepID=A0ABT1YRG4_9BACL|nr:Arm DNA-binding domain-containing protein [Paenibacillus radicis (ex Xue et al. 2023)]MCR8635777.1 Arm DNA-binding domain-containing protein [Paenibacillus radicis (ex Xue et al. 2023)]